ncbi:hypothetical protein SGPA1_50834 [Streptomyces misionensis JCM 4497]
MARATSPSVLGTDSCRAHQRRVQTVAAPAAVHRPPRDLHGNPPRHRRTGLRPLRPQVHATQARHRTRAHPAGRLLITPSRPVTSMARPQSLPRS